MRQRMFAAMAAFACAVALTGVQRRGHPTQPRPDQSRPVVIVGNRARPARPPTPTKTLTPEEQDLRSAEEAITEYWRVIDEAASDPTQSLNVLATVARSQALAQWQTTLGGYRSKSWVQRGSSTVEDAKATTEDGEGFTVTACRDVSAVDVIDDSGNSVVRSDRPDRQQFTYPVLKAPEGFFVTEDQLKGSPCAEIARAAAFAISVLLLSAHLAAATAPPVSCPPGEVPDPNTGSCTIVVTPPPDTGSPGSRELLPVRSAAAPRLPRNRSAGTACPRRRRRCRARVSRAGGFSLGSATRRWPHRSRRLRTRCGRDVRRVRSTTVTDRSWGLVGSSWPSSGRRRLPGWGLHRTPERWRSRPWR